MKHGNGIKDRDDRSSGIEILMTDTFAKINPTDPLRLVKQVARRKRNWFQIILMWCARAQTGTINIFLTTEKDDTVLYQWRDPPDISTVFDRTGASCSQWVFVVVHIDDGITSTKGSALSQLLWLWNGLRVPTHRGAPGPGTPVTVSLDTPIIHHYYNERFVLRWEICIY